LHEHDEHSRAAGGPDNGRRRSGTPGEPPADRRVLASILALLALLLAQPVVARWGAFTYQMDDTYIHMAMARNLAEHGVWSINPDGFISASSSLLYTAILAALFRLTVPTLHMFVPLAVNVILAVVLLVCADRILREHGRRPVSRFLVLTLVVLAVPLPGITFMSMEHVLHMLLSILVVHRFARFLAGGRRSDGVAVLALLPLLCTVRFEGLFFLPPMLGILAIRRRFRFAAAALTAAVLPLAAFGAFSVSQGSFALPNPIVIKGVVKAKEAIEEVPSAPLWQRGDEAPAPGLAAGTKESPPTPPAASGTAPVHRALRVAGSLAERFVTKSWIFALLSLTTIFCWMRVRRTRAIVDPVAIYYLVFVTVLATHVVLAGIGRQYRYEAYLMGMGFVLLGMTAPGAADLRELSRSHGVRKLLLALPLLVGTMAVGAAVDRDPERIGPDAYGIAAVIVAIPVAAYVIRGRRDAATVGAGGAVAAAMFVFLVPMVARGTARQLEVPLAMRSIHEQQMQMARFIGRYYAGTTVAVNDIGAVAYFGGATILDLWGLGDDEVLKARLTGEYDTSCIDRLIRTRKVDLVIVYENWFDPFGGLPPSLQRAGTWEVERGVVLGGRLVSFFAPDAASLARLRAQLKEYEPSLPAEVAVRYGDA
jgi:hypothetical protein